MEAVFQSNYIAPIGSALDGFELGIAEKVKCRSVAALNSGTSAIHLALVLLNVGKQDSVIVQSKTHIGGVNPIIYQGATPVFVDSERETWNMCPRFLEIALKDQIKKGKKPKAIILVHLYGMPAKMQELVEVALKYEIPIIEDAAESLGSKYQDQHTGTFGLMGVYSFNGNKIITTGGGGALVSNNKELIEKAKFLATQAKDDFSYYQHSHIGYNYRLSNVLAAIGEGQLMVLDERVSQLRTNFEKYVVFFQNWNAKGFNIQFQNEPKAMFSNRWLTTVLVDPKTNHGVNKEDLRLALEKENIESRPLWKPMHLQPIFEISKFYGEGVSEELFEYGLCLPSGSNMGDQEFHRIFEVINRIFHFANH